MPGYEDAGVRRCRGTKMPGYEDAGVRRCRGTKMSGTKMPGYEDAGVQRCRGTKMPGYEDAGVRENQPGQIYYYSGGDGVNAGWYFLSDYTYHISTLAVLVNHFKKIIYIYIGYNIYIYISEGYRGMPQ